MKAAKIDIKLLSGANDRPCTLWKYRIQFVLQQYAGAVEVVNGTLTMIVELDPSATTMEERKF